MVLLISYDLDGHERPSAYTEVKKAIERHAISARKALYSQWLVETNDSPSVWSERLNAVIDSDDNLLIVRVRDGYAGQLSTGIWPWLEARV